MEEVQNSNFYVQILCYPVAAQLAVAEAVTFLCYQFATRYAGNAPEHYVANFIC